jgi:hypothetical protein
MMHPITKWSLALSAAVLWGLPPHACAAETRSRKPAAQGRTTRALSTDAGDKVPAPLKRQGQQTDPRLSRKVTLSLKGASLADFCAQLQAQTGVEMRASRGVADEKVTVFVKEQPARPLMRAVARLFGYFWERRGEAGSLRYELNQDLKSRLVEEELRNRDLHAALLVLDEQMQQYRPYLDMSLDEMGKRSEQNREVARLLINITHNLGWAGMQLYHRLTAAERAALASGHELVFRPDAADPDRRLPLEWTRSILQSWGNQAPTAADLLPAADITQFKVPQVRLWIDRSELGQLTLASRVTTRSSPPDGAHFIDVELATGRSPAAANADNAKANGALRGQSPFDSVISLRPRPSCLTVQKMLRGQIQRLPYGVHSAAIGDLQRPHVFSADVWEAVHRETGLPIVADYYTRMHRLDQMTLSGKSVFETLCSVSDAMGVRWAKDGEILLCRSTSYFWDKLKEVPNRYLERWIADRDANGGLPLTDLLEMATLSDPQLDSVIVSEAITHCHGLRDWGHMRWLSSRTDVRFFATLTPEQQRRAFTLERLDFKELTPAQQEGAVQLQNTRTAAMERQYGSANPIDPEWWAHASIGAEYVPAGWYVFRPPDFNPPVSMAPVVGKTAAEVLAAARRLWPEAPADRVKQEPDGRFSCGVSFMFRSGPGS